MSSSKFMLQFLACKKVVDKGADGHVSVWCASKLNKSQKLTSAMCKPVKSLNNGPAQLVVMVAKGGGGK